MIKYLKKLLQSCGNRCIIFMYIQVEKEKGITE